MDLKDEALIKKYREEGDISVFTTLVKRYQSRVFSIAFRLLNNSEEAEEIVQDTFVRVHQNLDKFRADAVFASWLFRITHNLCMDALRQRLRKKSSSVVSFDPQSTVAEDEGHKGLSTPMTQIADETPNPSQSLDMSEQTNMVEKSLNELPEAQKMVLILHDLQGFSYVEVAEIVGTSVGTVRSRLHYGRLKLKELLSPYFSNELNLPATFR